MWLLVLCLALFYVSARLYTFYTTLRRNDVPGWTAAVMSGTLISFFLPQKWPLVIPRAFRSNNGFGLHKQMGCTIIRLSGALWPPGGASSYYLADAVAVEEMTSNPTGYVKPLYMYKSLSFFGANVVITEGETWRRHRRITAPAFSKDNNALVFEETLRVMNDWMQAVMPKSGDVHRDEEVTLTTMQMALMIISAAAFGKRDSWFDTDSAAPPAGHKLAFRPALQAVLHNTFLRAAIPSWAYSLPFLPKKWRTKLDSVDSDFEEMDLWFDELIAERRNGSAHTGRRDLFNLLLAAKDNETGRGISEEELRGNLYIFLLAGHETSAHALAFALGLLAIETDKQDDLYAATQEVWPEDEPPTFADSSRFTYALATFHEALRLFPPVGHIPKMAAGDQLLSCASTDELPERRKIVIPDQSRLYIDVNALHRNPAHWTEPDAFNPSRFIDTEDHRWPRNAFASFSAGARSCLGISFAQVEVATILTFISKHFIVRLREEDKICDGETVLEARKRILATKNGLTLSPASLALVFERR